MTARVKRGNSHVNYVNKEDKKISENFFSLRSFKCRDFGLSSISHCSSTNRRIIILYVSYCVISKDPQGYWNQEDINQKYETG
jgi:hypothetical protein